MTSAPSPASTSTSSEDVMARPGNRSINAEALLCTACHYKQPAFQRQRQDAVVGALGAAAELAFEVVDARLLGDGLVLEEPAPVVSFDTDLPEAQHVAPMKPAIGASAQRTLLVVLAAEMRRRVQQRRPFPLDHVRMPYQTLAVARSRCENELSGLRRGCKPAPVRATDGFLPG